MLERFKRKPKEEKPQQGTVVDENGNTYVFDPKLRAFVISSVKMHRVEEDKEN